MSTPNPAPPSPIRNSYWVIPGKVLAGEHPSGTTVEATRERLQRLMDAGVECFIDLTEPGEIKQLYDPELPFSVEYLRKPVRDHGIPAQRAHMAEILDCIHDALQSGRCVYVHCRAGIGRTGTVIGCLLVERGFAGEAALDELNRLWQHCERAQSWGSIPETDDQVAYVRKWKPRAVFAEELTLASIAAREALVGKSGVASAAGAGAGVGVGTGVPAGSGTAVGFGPGASSATGAGALLGAASATDAGVLPGTGSVTGAGAVPGTGSAAGAGALSGTGFAAGAGAVPGTGSAAGAGAVPGTGSAAGAGALSGTGFAAGAGAVPGTGSVPGAGAPSGSASAAGVGAMPGTASATSAGALAGTASAAGAGAISGVGSPAGASGAAAGVGLSPGRASGASPGSPAPRSGGGATPGSGPVEPALVGLGLPLLDDDDDGPSDFASFNKARGIPSGTASSRGPTPVAKPDEWPSFGKQPSGARGSAAPGQGAQPGNAARERGSLASARDAAKSGATTKADAVAHGSARDPYNSAPDPVTTDPTRDARNPARDPVTTDPTRDARNPARDPVTTDSPRDARNPARDPVTTDSPRDARNPARDAATTDSSRDARNPARDAATTDSPRDARNPARDAATTDSPRDARNPARDPTTTDPTRDARNPARDPTTTDPTRDARSSARDPATTEPTRDTRSPARDPAPADPSHDPRAPAVVIPNATPDDDPLSDPEALSAARGLRDRFLGALLGLAVGDAVAAATQFRKSGTFTPVGDMIGGGPYDLPRGGWSDDTAMALCLADSLLERNGFDARDQMERYRRWQQEGYLSATGQCVGITASAARAIAMSAWRRGALFGSHDPSQLDPEPLSRVASAVLFFFAASGQAVEQATESARTTCQAPAVLEACRSLARALHAALSGQPKAIVLEKAVQAVGNAPGRTATGISATAALTAAVAAFGATANFRDAVLYAANLGGDSDVITTVCGQLAGAYYSVKAIPTSWHNGLIQKDLIISYADRLLAHAMLGMSG